MSRRTERMAQDAALAASEAARTLQQRGQEVRQERVEAPPPAPVQAEEPVSRKPRVEAEAPELEPGRIEQLRNANPADALREDLAKRQWERRGMQEEPDAPDAPADTKVVEPSPVVAPQKAVDGETAPAPALPEHVKVMVDGVEYEVNKSEVDASGGIAPYQQQKAAEKRFNEAREARDEAKRLRDEMMQMAERLKAPPPPAVSDAQFIASKMDIIRFGTPEEGAQAMAEIQQRGRMDPTAIVAQATTSMRYDQAMAQFKRDFADLHMNPILADTVGMQIQRALAPAFQNGAADWSKLSAIDFGNLFSTIGTQVRSVFGRPNQTTSAATAPATTGATQPDPTSPVSEKEARKASIVTLPTAAQRAVLPTEPKPPTREDILNEMRESRGQAKL